MAHVDTMLGRLHPLYNQGDLMRMVMGIPALQLEIADEDMRLIQPSHWYYQCLELDEAGRIGALLNIATEDWQDLQTYRAWFTALRDSLILMGGATVQSLETFVGEYVSLYTQAAQVDFMPTVPISQASDLHWSGVPAIDKACFIENPKIRRYNRVTSTSGIEPLQQFKVLQKGLDIAEASFLLVGLESAPESAPVIVNLTTGQALIYDGAIGPGQRLWITSNASGGVSARLELTDVSARIRSITGVTPGTPWTDAQVVSPAEPISFEIGENDLWYLPVATYDDPGLDRVLLALADLTLAEGRYDKTQFDHSLFYMDPAVILTVSWLETQPATIDIQLPGGLMDAPAPASTDPAVIAADLQRQVGQRTLLVQSLNEGIGRLKAAGVSVTVKLEPFRESQGLGDTLVSIQPIVVRERGPMGADRLVNKGGLFGVTDFNDSSYR